LDVAPGESIETMGDLLGGEQDAGDQVKDGVELGVDVVQRLQGGFAVGQAWGVGAAADARGSVDRLKVGDALVGVAGGLNLVAEGPVGPEAVGDLDADWGLDPWHPGPRQPFRAIT
jgi:hypothetical protein